MSLLDKDAPGWELSKENIQPVKEGRDPQKLNRVLTATATRGRAEDEAREQTRRHFEEAIAHADESDDPIQVWQDYCRWILDEYPEGDSWRSQLHPVIERMMEKFKDDDRYRDDGRYVRMWIRYADLMPNTSEVLSYMMVKNIGQKASLFYEAAASVYELARNYPLAEATYLKGIQVNAQPQDRLKGRFQDFKNRMKARAERSRRLAKQKELSKTQDGVSSGAVRPKTQPTYSVHTGRRGVLSINDENERPALGGLSARQASSSRRPVALHALPSGGLAKSSAKPCVPKTRKPFAEKSNANSDSIKICEDNPNEVKMLSPGGHKFPRLPKRSDMIKENNSGGIQTWAGATLKVRENLVRRRQQGPASNFYICEDEQRHNSEENIAEDDRALQRKDSCPTPTINTRQAVADVEAMFDSTLGFQPPVPRSSPDVLNEIMTSTSGIIDTDGPGQLTPEQQRWAESLPSYHRLYCDVDMKHDTPNFTGDEGQDLLTIEIEEDITKSGSDVSLFSIIDAKDVSDDPQQFLLKVCPQHHGDIREYFYYKLMKERGVSYGASCMTMAEAFYYGKTKTYLLLDQVGRCSLTKLVQVANGKKLANTVAMYLTSELIFVIESLHAVDIAHGSVGPDHFLIRDVQHAPDYNDRDDFPFRVMLVNLRYAADIANDPGAREKKVADWNRVIECLKVMLGGISGIQGPCEDAWNKIIEHLEIGEGAQARKVALESLEVMNDLHKELMNLNIKLFEDANRANITMLR